MAAACQASPLMMVTVFGAANLLLASIQWEDEPPVEEYMKKAGKFSACI